VLSLHPADGLKKGAPAMLLIRVVLQDSGVSVGRILSGIPHDFEAFIVYVLIGASLYFVWRGSRAKPKP
jgi:hypothetical protein